MKNNLELFPAPPPFVLKFTLNLMCQLVFFIVITHLNTCLHLFNLTWQPKGFFTKLCVLAPHDKKGLFKGRIVI